MNHYRHDMKLAAIQRARRAPMVIDLDPSEWEEVSRRTTSAKDTRHGAPATVSMWMLATILLLAIAAAPALAGLAHHMP